jgi:hypothetical protein
MTHTDSTFSGKASFDHTDLRVADFTCGVFKAAVGFTESKIGPGTIMDRASMPNATGLARLAYNGIPSDQEEQWLPAPKAHPEILTEKEARSLLSAIVRQLSSVVSKGGGAGDDDDDDDDGDSDDNGDEDDSSIAGMVDKMVSAMAAKGFGQDLELAACLGMLAVSGKARKGVSGDLKALAMTLKDIVLAQVSLQKKLLLALKEGVVKVPEQSKDQASASAVKVKMSLLAVLQKAQSELRDKARDRGGAQSEPVKHIDDGQLTVSVVSADGTAEGPVGVVLMMADLLTELFDLYSAGLKAACELARVLTGKPHMPAVEVGRPQVLPQVAPPSEFDVLEEKANEQLAKLKEATVDTLHKVRGGFEGARDAGEDAAEAALANAAKSIEGMIEKMIIEFCESGQDAVLEIKAKLLAMAKEKANKTFKEAYEKAQKYRCCSALQRMWWMFRELDPLVLTKHINEMEQILSLVNGLFELEVKDTNLDEVTCALQHATPRTQY